jgi:hypothetical protein
MPNDYSEPFKQVLQEAKDNPSILGLILGGSQGKGLYKDYSDYDFTIIVKDNISKKHRITIEKFNENPNFDCEVYTLAEFREYAEIGTEFEWNRYNFARNVALIDKTDGIIQKLVDEKGKIPEEFLERYVSGNLDGYINGVYRSIKCLRDGHILGYRLEAVFSIQFFLICAFAIHDRRLKPYYKYLAYELDQFPLEKFPWSAKELTNKILSIIETGDYKTQQELLIEMERVMRKEGFGEVFDSWEGDEKWTMFYEHTES